MKARLNKQNLIAAAIVFAGFSAAVFCFVYPFAGERKSAALFTADAGRDEKEAAVENALFARVEFFGAQAIVPFPTAEARDKLAALLEKYPQNAQILLKLAGLEEQLADYENAERHLNAFVELNAENEQSLEELAAYFGRRAQFERQAEILEKMLKRAPETRRAEIFGRLVETARIHKLEKYLTPEFYRQIIAENPASFAIIEDFIAKLFEEKRYDEALAALRQNRQNFPEKRETLFAKEIEILLAAGRTDDAEKVYHESFDAFWDAQKVESYYNFLRENNRLRAYGRELRARLKQDPIDFDAAVRLFHFKKNEYETEPEIFLALEKARVQKGINWSAEELLTISRLLIASGNGDAASRFLYTLLTKGEFSAKSELRAKILYQLFELLSDAGDERLALTRGDLKFYRDVASSDPHPGIVTGLLSLIFSDTKPHEELAAKEKKATKYFNRAAAYRIFQIYKDENPASPELAQMYLDIVRLYTATGETEIAAKTLAEFEQRPEFKNSNLPAYPRIALKLADALIVAKNFDREREVYRRLLDYLGKKQVSVGKSLVASSAQTSAEPTAVKPETLSYPFDSNPGIDAGQQPNDGERDYSYEETHFSDHLAEGGDEITYQDVLKRAVASLAKDNKTADILALYAAELEKYPNESGLYEETLQWLGQTNLVEEQLKIYKRAVQKFPETSWRDRLARWFLKQQRQQEFETYSRELLAKMGDTETQAFLKEFVDGKVSARAETFDSELYLGFYTLAHRRFPQNLQFVEGLLKFYQAHEQNAQWRLLAAEYYFIAPEIREEFLNELAKTRELRPHLEKAREKSENAARNALAALPYKLFRADSEVRLSNYEEAVEAYRELNRLYPNKPEFGGRFVNFTRSLGQNQKRLLGESAETAHDLAEAFPAFSEYRTQAGEIRAEIGDYDAARAEWNHLIEIGRGEPETYRAAATVFWDYFQYDDALATIERLRAELHDEALYAFETGAIFEAKHNREAALAEYMKALDGSTPFAKNVAESDRAKRRLEKLYRRAEYPAQIQAAFETERKRRADDSALVLGYADFLRRAENWEAAKRILADEISKNSSTDFLTETRELCQIANDGDTERLALKRLGETAKNRRAAIKYRLELAESFNDENRQAEAVQIVSRLVADYPTNFGVLDEASEFYWRIGQREAALQVLQGAMQSARGSYRTTFGRRLAGKLLTQNRLPEAERVLNQLYEENALDAGVFQELANIYVRGEDRANLDRIFQKTLAEIETQDINFREIRESVAELRGRMINAFTRLKDYDAAIGQHIEIINREPESEENVEAAVAYVKRYGGAETLLEYYRQTAETAYKNYRWFVVLARIYEANNDLDAAANNYNVAIENQPEMVELYDALADVYLAQKNFDAAITTLAKTLELTNDEPAQVRRFIAVLEKAGRHAEAEIAKQKLPVEEKPKQQDLRDQFAEAARLKTSERAKAVEMYRQAFDSISANPLAHDFKAADIVGYVQTVRSADDLGKINERLWQLREKLIREADRENSVDAGKARNLLAVLDGAMMDGLGSSAREFATGNERAALLADFSARIDSAIQQSDRHSTLPLLQNLSRKSGFGRLEERILIRQKENAFALKNAPDYHQRVADLLAFYRDRGDFQTVLEILETERVRDFEPAAFDYVPQIAETARLLNDEGKELNALREYFRRRCETCFQNGADALVERYLELLENGDAGKNELRELANNSSPFQIQLINFLIARGEKELAHSAIEHTALPETWRLARQAQTSLVLDEFSEKNERYFLAALNLKPIGELVKEAPDAAISLIGDDWFRLSNDYGKWLRKADKAANAEKFLPAMLENRPSDASEQARLGRWYLEQKDARRAVEHLELALSENEDDKNIIADLGSAYFLAGDASKARELWAKIIETDAATIKNTLPAHLVNDYELYLKALGKNGLGNEAREKLFPLVVKNIDDFYKQNSYPELDDKEFEIIKRQIRLLADSFGDEGQNPQISAEKAAFFLKLSESVGEEDDLVPAFLINESIIARPNLTSFYELLVRRSKRTDSSDYSFTDLLKNTFSEEIAEDALNAEKDYEIEEPENDRIRWQKEFLSYLLEKRQTAKAREIISAVERDIEQRFARPTWLRLARLEADLIEGKGAATLAEFKRFVGVSASPDAPKVALPSVERLNDSVRLLRRERLEKEADELQEAVYARLLALEQFNVSIFAALAEIEFRRGNAEFATRLLNLMIDLTDEEKQSAAAAEIAALDLVKNYAVEPAKTVDIEANNSLNKAEALKIAAETLAKFGQTDAALEFRQNLLILAPDDAANRIELARLFAAKQNAADSFEHISAVINDKNFARKTRWRALFAAAEIAGESGERWQLLKTRLPNLAAADREMRTALDALEIRKTKGASGGAAFLQGVKTEEKTANLSFLEGVWTAEINQPERALESFEAVVKTDKNAEMPKILSESENEIAGQIIALNVLSRRPRAALKLAEQNASVLQASEALKPETRRRVFELLSAAAETVGDFARAVEFERQHLDLLETEAEKQAARARIELLLELQKASAASRVTNFAVNQNNVSD